MPFPLPSVFGIVQELGHFFVGRPFEAHRWSLTEGIAELLRLNGAPLFDVLVDVDPKNSSR